MVVEGLTNLGLIKGEDSEKLDIPDQFRMWSRTTYPDIDYAWKLTEKLIVKLKESVESSGGKLAIFYVPSLENVDNNVWEATKVKYGMSDNEWDLNAVESRLLDICRTHGIPYMNPTSIFREKTTSQGRIGYYLYYPRDRHWNSVGHKLAGELLYSFISSEFLSQPQAAENLSKNFPVKQSQHNPSCSSRF